MIYWSLFSQKHFFISASKIGQFAVFVWFDHDWMNILRLLLSYNKLKMSTWDLELVMGGFLET